MEETKPWLGTGGPSKPRAHHPVVSWVKRWLRPRSTCRSPEEGSEGPPGGGPEEGSEGPPGGGPEEGSEGPPGGGRKEGCWCLRHHFPLAAVIVVALVVMALLLLLNYKCYMVWRLCEDNEIYRSYVNLDDLWNGKGRGTLKGQTD